MVPTTRPSFYNWQTDTTAIQDAYDWLVEGLFFDVRENDLWPETWGPKPDSEEEQEARVRKLVARAPKLIPVYAHRYLLAEPCQAGNPVISIWQSDMVIYGVDLHDYFLTEFASLTGSKRERGSLLRKEKYQAYKKIPFWGAFL